MAWIFVSAWIFIHFSLLDENWNKVPQFLLSFFSQWIFFQTLNNCSQIDFFSLSVRFPPTST